MFEAILRWWCREFHTKVLRPVRGKYICAECLREWPVAWELEPIPGVLPTRSHSTSDDVVVMAPSSSVLMIRLPKLSFRSTQVRAQHAGQQPALPPA
jgi:hypothetical protein